MFIDHKFFREQSVFTDQDVINNVKSTYHYSRILYNPVVQFHIQKNQPRCYVLVDGANHDKSITELRLRTDIEKRPPGCSLLFTELQHVQQPRTGCYAAAKRAQ